MTFLLSKRRKNLSCLSVQSIIGATETFLFIFNYFFSSLWAEIYGVNHLGSIRALTGALMVFSTALATATFGFLIDLGSSIEEIAFLCSLYVVVSLAIVYIFRKSYKPILEEKT